MTLMMFLLVLIFIVVPILEIYVIIQVGQAIGPLWTILLLIAENERLSSQCLYFGEGVVREVKRWFDRPPYSTIGDKNLVRPTTAVMIRNLRSIDVDGAGPTAAVAADGSVGAPYYKRWTTGPRDVDGDGNDDIFDKPYRTALVDMLVGTKDGPDIRMDRTTNSATAICCMRRNRYPGAA
jgi:hypothetical protein